MQTLKKLPQIAPKIAAAATAKGDDSQAALSAMPGNAKVSSGLKRILLSWPRPSSLRLGLVLALAVVPAACHRAPDAAARRQTATLAEALRPSFLMEAIRRAGGAHYHGTARFAAGVATPDDGVTTTTDVWIDRARNFHLAETNDRDGGREVVLAGRELLVALRYGKMIRRVAEEPEPTRLLEEALGAPWAAWEIAAPWAAVQRGAGAGAGAAEYRLSLAPARTEDPAIAETNKGLRAWRADVVVDQLAGRAVVDDATGALRELELTASFTTKRDGRPLKGALEVRGALTELGATAAVVAPPAEDLALRQRIVPEQRELLGGLPSTRLPPPPPPKAARTTPPGAPARPAAPPTPAATPPAGKTAAPRGTTP
jgi:hypothetical protein